MSPIITITGENPHIGACDKCEEIQQIMDYTLGGSCDCGECEDLEDVTFTATRCVPCLMTFLDKAHGRFPQATIRVRIDNEEIVYDPSP